MLIFGVLFYSISFRVKILCLMCRVFAVYILINRILKSRGGVRGGGTSPPPPPPPPPPTHTHTHERVGKLLRSVGKN
jgi:hypothetical protein